MRNEFLERKAMTAAQYRSVISTLVKVLEKTVKDKVSFLLYGSFLDDRLQPGLSDIDGVFFFWDHFVTDKKTLLTLAEQLREEFQFLRFDFAGFMDLSTIDAGNASDGRFIPYNDNFSKIFDANTGDSQIVFGKEFVSALSLVKLIDPVEAHLAYNLQSLRNHICFGRCTYRWPNGVNPYKELRTMRQIQAVSRKVMMLIESDNIALAKSKREALKRLETLAQWIDFEPFWVVDRLMQDISKVIDLILAATQSPILLINALDCYERTLQWVVQTRPARSFKPQANQKEVAV